MANTPADKQPPFDKRISTLAFPLEGGQFGNLSRGYMVWDKSIPGFSNKARVDFLYNPSTVEADYGISTPGISANLIFPNANDSTDLRVPLNQTAEWSLLYDRTYELWGSYGPEGDSKTASTAPNDPSIVGVLADIYQMEQFTGMTVSYSKNGQVSRATSKDSLKGRQGILQLIPSYVYFGNKNVLAYYGYITEWDVQITHWTQYMVPMRCVIDIQWNMLPPPNNKETVTGGATPPAPPPGHFFQGNGSSNTLPTSSNTGRSGR